MTLEKNYFNETVASVDFSRPMDYVFLITTFAQLLLNLAQMVLIILSYFYGTSSGSRNSKTENKTLFERVVPKLFHRMPPKSVSYFILLLSLSGFADGVLHLMLIFDFNLQDDFFSSVVLVFTAYLTVTGNLTILRKFTVMSKYLKGHHVTYIQVFFSLLYIGSQFGSFMMFGYWNNISAAPAWLISVANWGIFFFFMACVLYEWFQVYFIVSTLSILSRGSKKASKSSNLHLQLFSVFCLVWDGMCVGLIIWLGNSPTTPLSLSAFIYQMAMMHCNLLVLQFYLAQRIIFKRASAKKEMKAIEMLAPVENGQSSNVVREGEGMGSPVKVSDRNVFLHDAVNHMIMKVPSNARLLKRSEEEEVEEEEEEGDDGGETKEAQDATQRKH